MSKSVSVGTVLKVNAKTIGALTSIGGIEISKDTVEVTDLGSSDGFKEFVGGFSDGGEVSCSGFMDGADDGQAEMYTQLAEEDPVACSIVFPAKIGKTWTFDAIVTKFSTSVDLNDAVKFEASLKVSGKPTLAATAS